MAIKYHRIIDTLKSEILGGKYARRSSFPSIVSVCKRFKISRLTAFKVFDGLKEEGLISSRSGSGTYVTKVGASRTFGLILPGVSNYEYFQPIATELSQLALKAGYAFLFSNVDSSDPVQLRHNIRELAADYIKRRVAGVVYHPMEFSSEDDTTNAEIVAVFDRAKIPVILLDSDIVPPPKAGNHDVISIDNASAAERITNHLLDAGARNVHVLMLPRWFPNMMNRVRGVICAMALRRRKWSMSNILVAKPDDIVAVRKYMRRRPRPDAFVCQNDEVAAAFKQTLEKLKLKVPDDVMLVGFDGLEISRLVSPPLTTIRQPFEKVANTIFSRLLQRISDPALPPLKMYVPDAVVARVSTKRGGKRK